MINHLYIKNFVLIDDVSLEFKSGFSAFIGETGAGKSVLIDAISLLRADRASVSLIAKDAEKAIVEGTFDLSDDAHAQSVLKEAGFDCEQEVTFTREIHRSGKSTVRIDHRIVTLSLMKEVLERQIDIHGQRDSQYLLNTASHIDLLDQYLKTEDLRREVRESYQAWKLLVREKEKALQETYNESDLEFFHHEISEIEAADLREGEEEELQEKEKQYKSVKASYEKLSAILDSYDDSLSSSLYEMNRMVQSLDDNELFQSAKNAMNDAYYGIADAVDTLRRGYDDMDLSEEEINAMEERLFLIQRMKRRYGRSIAEILKKKEELEGQVERIAHRNEYLEQIGRRIDAAFAEYRKRAEKLSEVRRKGVKKLDRAIAAHLGDLMLEHARFTVDIRTCDPGETGMDRVEFMIAMNRGEDPKPLSKTASGGELSRLMLGLKAVFTELEGIETVIFDEIDSGVSGPVASAIGRKMKELSRSAQVFSVTHLAPVAASADHHYFVSKSEEDGRVHTHVKALNRKEIIEELAVISGGELTEAGIAAAEELYERSRES